MATGIVAGLGESHGISSGESSHEAFAERACIRKAELLDVAGSTGNRVILRKRYIIKKNPAQRGPGICDLVGRGLVVSTDISRRIEIAWQGRVGVVIGHCGQIQENGVCLDLPERELLAERREGHRGGEQKAGEGSQPQGDLFH